VSCGTIQLIIYEFAKQKRERKRSCGIFSKWHNSTFKSDFEPFPDSNDEQIDYILKSTSDVSKLRYLQLVNCDKETIKVMLEYKNSPNEVFDREISPIEYILEALDKKGNKYPPEVQKSLILVIWSNFSFMASINKGFLKNEINNTCNFTHFKEIYYVVLPDNAEKNSYPINTGDITRLK